MDAAGTTKPREQGQANFDTVSVTRASIYATTNITLNQSVYYTLHTEAASRSTQRPRRLGVREEILFYFVVSIGPENNYLDITCCRSGFSRELYAISYNGSRLKPLLQNT